MIKDEILKDLIKGDLIKGSGGFRKIRIADSSNNAGKRGSYRVIYLDLPKKETTYLILLYAKAGVENISAEQLKALKVMAEGIKNE